METIKISKEDYKYLLTFKKLVALEPQLADLFKNDASLEKLAMMLSLALALKEEKSVVEPKVPKRPTMEFGSGKHLISYMADDFDDPLPGFGERASIRKPGSGKHLIGAMADDFDDPLPEFAEYR